MAQLTLDLNLERSTWELIHALYADRIETEQFGDDWDEGDIMITDITVRRRGKVQ